jgi:hypothetical protein
MRGVLATLARAGSCAVLLGLMFSTPAVVSAQRGRGAASGAKPAVDVVQTIGCVEQRTGSPETWWLQKAAEPRVVQPGVFSVAQIDTARGAALGSQTVQLIGVADFLDVNGLLKSGRRSEFTTPQNANATGELRPGRKVLVKGMYIANTEPKRINLLNVVGLADSCG